MILAARAFQLGTLHAILSFDARKTAAQICSGIVPGQPQAVVLNPLPPNILCRIGHLGGDRSVGLRVLHHVSRYLPPQPSTSVRKAPNCGAKRMHSEPDSITPLLGRNDLAVGIPIALVIGT